jgi:hypothetical protein
MVVLFVCFFSGCSSYVNIPAQPGDVARHDPNDLMIVNAMAEGLNAAVVDQHLQGRYGFILPEGVDEDGYRYVGERLGLQAVWPADASNGELPVLEVKEIRIRGSNGQLDVVRPVSSANRSFRQLVTVYLTQNPVTGWHASQVRVWRANAEDVSIPTP